MRGITNTALLFKGSHVPGSMRASGASAITESFSGYSPTQWIFVSTKITATGNAFRVMDLFSVPAPTPSPYTRLSPPTPTPPSQCAQASVPAGEQVKDMCSGPWAGGENRADLSSHLQPMFIGKLLFHMAGVIVKVWKNFRRVPQVFRV